MLDRTAEAASKPDERDLYQAQLDIFLNPNDPKVIAAYLGADEEEAIAVMGSGT